MDWQQLDTTLDNANLDFLAGHPFIFHCHHFNLFLDQTVDDACGPELGVELRTKAARHSSYHFLSRLFAELGLNTPAERLTLAMEVFAGLGHGHLHIDANVDGGTAEGEFLHYSFAWKEKYGGKIARLTPVDAFAAGFVAAAVQAAFDYEFSFTATEESCYAMHAERCAFKIEAIMDMEEFNLVDLAITKQHIGQAYVDGLEEERIQAITVGLREFLKSVQGDEHRGLIETFGVFVTRHTPNYYNMITCEALDYTKKNNPEFLAIVEELVRESGHVCVFNTFAGILYSPEWDALVGRVQGGLNEVVSSCMAIARALGFGTWAIKELSEDRLVIITGSEYESPYCAISDHALKESNAYFIQGAGIAIMRLWEALDWQKRPLLNQELYNQLFKSGSHWEATQTQSLANGDPYTEVVVSRR